MNTVQEHYEKSISMQELLLLLKRNIVWLIAAALVGGILTFGICSFLVTPVYKASAKMIVNSRVEQNNNVTNDQLTSAQKLVDTYAIIIRSQPVLDPVIETLELPMDVEKLAKKVTVTSVNDTQVMEIAVESTDANQALRIVEEIVKICPAIIIDAVEAGSVKTVEPAHLHNKPVSPHTTLFTLLAACLCALGVLTVLMLRHLLDNTYKSEADLRNDLELPVLGVIPDYEYCLKQKNEGKEAKYYGKV